MLRWRHHLFITLLIASLATLVISGQSQTRGRQAQSPSRDTSAQRAATTDTAPAPKGQIAGRVLTSDTGRPVARARVFINAAEVPGGRGTLTDSDGTYEFTELPAGRYTVTVSKTGFISLQYGQRRPLQAGTPLQLSDGQQLNGVDFSLPRGSVIAGHVMDESGDPMPGITVQVMRYQYAQGNRQLTPAGGGQTDDQGAFRVWGLNPGEYYVSAVARTLNLGGRGGPGRGGPAGPPPGFGPDGAGGGRGGRGGGRAGAAGAGRGAIGVAIDPAALGANAQQLFTQLSAQFSNGVGSDSEPVTYAPTFYPGVPSVDEARAVTVGLSVEVLDVNFGLLLVRTSRISGHVTKSDGSPSTTGNVTLMPDSAIGGRAVGRMLGGRVQWDGSFSIASVPPGRYVIRARGDDTDPPQFATQPITVSEADLADITVALAPGASISGTVTFQSTQSLTVPDASQVRVAAPPIDFANVGPNPIARVNKDGTFTLDGVSAGQHWIRTQGGLRGWTLKSVTLGGREIIDTPLDVRSGQSLTGLTLIFTDKMAEVNGMLTDERDQPLTEFTVLVFPTDNTLWRPQARQIMTARPDQTGKYQIRGLPAGNYFVTAVDPAEQGEWFEPAFLDQHRNGAARLTLGDGDVKTQDFKLSLK